MPTTTVKYSHSALNNAPVLAGQAGSLVALLDAVLVDGWGAKVADSILVQNGLATVALSTGHSFETDMIMLVSGCTVAALNGEKRIVSATTISVTFDATGIADTNQVAGILVKVAPAGWQRAFSDTNVRVYRSADTTGTRMYLRVDDTGTTNARVRAAEVMTDIITGTNPFPTDAQKSGGGWWPKSNAASTAARSWMIVADSKTFYINVCSSALSQSLGGSTWGFGDFASRRTGDPFACMLISANSDVTAVTTETGESLEYWYFDGTSYYKHIPRGYSGLGASTGVQTRAEFNCGGGVASGATNANLCVYPNPIDNSIILSRMIIVEAPANGIRGYVRGSFGVMNQAHTFFNSASKMVGDGDLFGRTVLFCKSGGPAAIASRGIIAFDITGPWS